jgi:hypothetical protein
MAVLLESTSKQTCFISIKNTFKFITWQRSGRNSSHCFTVSSLTLLLSSCKKKKIFFKPQGYFDCLLP